MPRLLSNRLPDRELLASISSEEKLGARRIRWYVVVAFLLFLAYTLYLLVTPFLEPICWALIVAIGTWPLYTRVLHFFPHRKQLVAFLTSLLISLLFLGAVFPIVAGVGGEIEVALEEIQQYLESNLPHIQRWFTHYFPIGVAFLEDLSDREQRESMELLRDAFPSVYGTATAAARRVFEFFFELLTFVVSVYFMFRYGADFLNQFRCALVRLDERAEALLEVSRKTMIGTLYGTILTAVAQGVLAGIGFAVAGAPAPTLVGLAVMIFSFIPYGPPIIYLPGAFLLVVGGAPFLHGILLAAWGVFVVSLADNVIKPLSISHQVKLPLPMVLIGVIGGIFAFGLIGVFIGPIVMSVLRALWIEWIGSGAVSSSQ